LEELPMARPIARDAEDFARLMLQTIERRGPAGDWIAVRELFELTASRHPLHVFVGHVAAKPTRRNTLGATLERLRAAEFPSIERRKESGQRMAPTLYRSPRRAAAAVEPERQRSVSLDLQLPYEAPASHPLLNERRAAEARGDQPGSARRSAMTESAPNSPWRRRLLPRRLPLPPGGLEQAWYSVRQYWGRLRATVSELAAGVGGR
jgi:hypothetical protein